MNINKSQKQLHVKINKLLKIHVKNEAYENKLSTEKLRENKLIVKNYMLK